MSPTVLKLWSTDAFAPKVFVREAFVFLSEPEIKIAKPIVPYEKRIFEHNEPNSRRDGETYKVKIAKIVFEDGTQWKNPAVKDSAL